MSLQAKEIQAFGLQSVVHGFYEKLLSSPLEAKRKTTFGSGLAMGMVQFLTFGFYAGAFYYGGWLVENDFIDFEGFMKALFVLAFMASGAGQAATYAGNQTKAKPQLHLRSSNSLTDRRPLTPNHGLTIFPRGRLTLIASFLPMNLRAKWSLRVFILHTQREVRQTSSQVYL